MRAIVTLRTLGAWLSLLLLCSCATLPGPEPGPAIFNPARIVPATDLPAEVVMNQDAGRGNFLFVTIRLESGEELPFVVDTGAPGTVFDKSLKSKLGKRLDTTTIIMPGDEQEAGVHAAPKLYLGNTPLVTGTNVFTLDLKRLSARCGRPIKGILGMDCLRHYRIQLDFEAGKLRFLNADQVKEGGLGKAFALIFSSEDQEDDWYFRPYIHHAGLFGGTSTNMVIDTGATSDGVVDKIVLNGHWWARIKHYVEPARAFSFPKCEWDGETYTDLVVEVNGHANWIGLRFLARHLVTFDFPKGTMYLKRTSGGPLRNEKATAVQSRGK